MDILDVYSEEWTDLVNINLKMQPSLLMKNNFRWHCKEGFPANIEKVMNEFGRY